MKKRFPCPEGTDGRCKVLELSGLKRGDCDDAVSFVVDNFPAMHINQRFWKEKLCNEKTKVMKEIKKDGEEIIGITNVSFKSNKTSSLDCIAVDPKYRGMGLGSLLLEESERMSAKSGKGIMKLMTEQIKPENISFYSNRGYKIIGFDPTGYDHSPSVQFEKRIA